MRGAGVSAMGKRRWYSFGLVIAAVVALAPATGGRADSPPRLPADKTVCSPNGAYCARMEVERNRVTVVAGDQVLWTMKGWFRDAHLADDGRHLIVGYDGRNLLEKDFRPDTVLVTFWDRGRLIRKLPLSRVIEDFSRLEPTVSHFQWGHTVGIDRDGRFVIHTVEDRRIAFDVESGLAVATWPETYPSH